MGAVPELDAVGQRKVVVRGLADRGMGLEGDRSFEIGKRLSRLLKNSSSKGTFEGSPKGEM